MTFMFADLRGFADFVDRRGDAAATRLIADYRRVVRAEVGRTGGGEIKTEGDSFYVIFRSARAALECAMAVLRTADEYSHEHASAPMRIGIGLHAGEPIPYQGQYVGAAVILAARLAQSADAGELLISDVVRGLIPKSALPSLRERDQPALKGVEDPPRILAVAWQEGLRDQRVALPPDPTPRRPDRRILCPDLVGREDALAALAVHLSDTSAGHGRVVLLAGIAGIGKSACLRRFLDYARASGARTLLGECIEIEASRPFGAFVDALTSAGIVVPKELTHGLAEPGIAVFERYRVHAGFARALTALAGRAPVVVAIEDIHWADEATLELIVYMSRKLQDHRVLLLLTYRSDEVHRTHPLTHTLAGLARTRLVSEVKLEPLAEAETALAIRGALRLDHPPTATFRSAIHERCEGNPFFIEEVLRALVERGELVMREGTWRLPEDLREMVIPLSVQDTVEARLRALTPVTQRVVQVAAVIGQRFDFELLQAVAKMDEAGLISSLRAAIDAQLVVEQPARFADARFTFRHALTRETVLLGLLERERRQIHRFVGEALQARAEPLVASVAEDLAYHFDEARDQERAFQYRQLAADQAERAMSYARAMRHLDRAIALAPRGDPFVGELYLRLAATAKITPDLPRAVAAAEEARRIFETAGLPLRAGEALTRRAEYQWLLGSASSLVSATEAVSTLEPQGNTPELASAYAELAREQYLNCEHTGAERSVTRAMQIARETDSSAIEIDAMATLAGLQLDLRKPGGLELQRMALERALSAGLVGTAHRIYYNLQYYLQGCWAADDARQVHEAWVRYGERSSHRPDHLISQQAMFALIDADYDRVLKLVDDVGDSRGAIVARLHRAFVRVARSGPRSGDEDIAAVHEEMHRAGATVASHRAQWAALLAEIALLGGDAGTALAHAADATKLMAPLWAPWMEVPAALAAGLLAALRLEDRDAVEEWSALARQAAHPQDEHRPAWDLVEAERLAAAEEIDAASLLYQRSAQHFRSAFPLIWTLIVLREQELRIAHLLPRDPEETAARLRDVLDYWRKAGATWYLGELERWAKSHGVAMTIAPETDRRRGPARLTARESEVAQFVAQGMTNKEIAERLVLSERTVEGHVERILGKLGFRSRAQIAAWWTSTPTAP